jgi:phosphatidylinositol glycan class B
MIFQLVAQDLLILRLGGVKSLLIYISLWSTSYFGTRTLSNVTETLLYLLLYYYRSPVFLIVLAFWIRPTSLAASIFFFPWKSGLTLRNCLIGLLSVSALTLFDALVYQQVSLPSPLFTPLRFLYFNFVKNWAVLFGTQPLLFYFYSCIPSVFLVLTPYLLKISNKRHFKFALFSVCVLSLSGHKEIRYLAPIIPFIVLDLAKVCPNWVCYVNFVVQMLVLVFLGSFHQIGQTEVMKYVAESPKSTVFLLPCCSTPLTSFVHRNVLLKSLDCSPDGSGESRRFVEDPLSFVCGLNWVYERVVTYSGYGKVLEEFLSEKDFVKKVELFNSFFELDGINTSHVVMYERV